MDSGRLVLSFASEREILLRGGTVIHEGCRTLFLHEKARDSVDLGTWLHGAFPGLSGLRWHRVKKFFTKISL